MSQLSTIYPYQIAGNLNFGSVPAANDYGSAYQNALSLNQQNYGNILSGYGQTMANQQQAQQGIQQGYGNLSSQVLGDIQGIGASQSQAIRDTYAQQQGRSTQGLVSRGLGNTTVANTVQRGNLYDKQKADTGLANQMAQLTAGYRSNLGLAGLNYANTANMQNTGLAGQQLGFMNSVNAPYPNALGYGQLAQQQGYADRASQLYGQVGMGGRGAGAGGLSVQGLNTGSGLPGWRGGGGGAPAMMGGGGYGGAATGRSPGQSSGPPIDTTGAEGTTQGMVDEFSQGDYGNPTTPYQWSDQSGGGDPYAGYDQYGGYTPPASDSGGDYGYDDWE